MYSLLVRNAWNEIDLEIAFERPISPKQAFVMIMVRMGNMLSEDNLSLDPNQFLDEEKKESFYFECLDGDIDITFGPIVFRDDEADTCLDFFEDFT